MFPKVSGEKEKEGGRRATITSLYTPAGSPMEKAGSPFPEPPMSPFRLEHEREKERTRNNNLDNVDAEAVEDEETASDDDDDDDDDDVGSPMGKLEQSLGSETSFVEFGKGKGNVGGIGYGGRQTARHMSVVDVRFNATVEELQETADPTITGIKKRLSKMKPHELLMHSERNIDFSTLEGGAQSQSRRAIEQKGDARPADSHYTGQRVQDDVDELMKNMGSVDFDSDHVADAQNDNTEGDADRLLNSIGLLRYKAELQQVIVEANLHDMAGKTWGVEVLSYLGHEDLAHTTMTDKEKDLLVAKLTEN